MGKYDFRKIEKKWQEQWLEEKVFKASDDSGKTKYYQLETFPYPSAAGLHVGHPKGYIAEDIHARYKRMRGFEVLYTMGWDAFGLPTENYAIKVKESPKAVAAANIKNFKRQVQMFGFSYDWDREINTASPEYYQWTQWLFIQLFKKGLAYRAKAKVNWCPKDQTVLANEQVINGFCERCETKVEQREMEQWFFKITDYTEKLLNGLEKLDWPEATIKRQKDWIGRSEGALLKFPISNSQFLIEVFTTRPDTLFGATYMVLAPEHEIVQKLKNQIKNWGEVESYLEKTKGKTELMRQEEAREKTGVELKGVKAINPANKEEIPIFVAEYVLASYGTGAIMAVPAHDERDFEFAKKFKLPVAQVVEPKFVGEEGDAGVRPGLPFVKRNAVCVIVRNPKDNTYLCNNWKQFHMRGLFTGGIEDGEDIIEAARREIQEETGYKNLKYVKTSPVAINTFFYHRVKQQNRQAHFQFVFFDLENEERDAVDKEETAIHEIVWKKKNELKDFFTVFERQFLLELLEKPDYVFTGNGIMANSGKFNGMDSEKAKWEIVDFVGGEKKVQYRLRDWSVSRQRYWGVPIPMIHCEKCGIVPIPEEDLPLILPDLENYRPKGKPPLASSEKFVNVKCPECGEKARRDPETLDTFVDSSWYYLRYADPNNEKTFADPKKLKHWLPVDLYIIGAEHTTLHLLYARFITKFLHDLGLLDFEEPFLRLRHVGLILGNDGQKMSKSRGNVVNPDELIEEFGADTVRLYEMFMGPFEDSHPWDPQGVVGVHRFLQRVWRLFSSETQGAGKIERELERKIHQTVKKVTEDIENFRYNTAISALMILFNEMEKGKSLSHVTLSIFLKLLAPFAPYITEELWSDLKSDSDSGRRGSIHLGEWPEYDPKLIEEETFTLIIQINGKTRDQIEASRGIGQAEAEQLALERERVKIHLKGQQPKKVFFVPNRLINFVI